MEVYLSLCMAKQPGQVAKEHYSYSKHGSCVVMGAMAPHLGQRLLAVYEQRTKKEYTKFMKMIAQAYSKALPCRSVMNKYWTSTGL